MILVRGATVYRRTGLERADVLLEGPLVKAVGQVAPPEGCCIVEGEGLVLGPGLVDLHVHFRDPGQTWKEDLVTGSRAAAAGGFTAVVTMPNTNPPIDSPTIVSDLLDRADSDALIQVEVAGAVTEGRRGQTLADIAGMYDAGVRLFTDDGDAVAEPSVLRKAMSLIAGLPGAVLADHPEDPRLGSGGHMHDGHLVSSQGISGLSAESELGVIERDVAMAEETGGRLHVQHVSTAGGVEMIAAAKERGLPVTAEVTPHHLALTVGSLSTLDPNFKMYPPLREEGDREALAGALRSGVIDAVATDHAPHSEAEKAVNFEDAPRGVIGLETAIPMALRALQGHLSLLFDRLSVAPARIAGLDSQGNAVEPGSPANLVLIDPHLRWTPRRFASKSSNSPFAGRDLRGRAKLTIHRGRVVYELRDSNA